MRALVIQGRIEWHSDVERLELCTETRVSTSKRTAIHLGSRTNEHTDKQEDRYGVREFVSPRNRVIANKYKLALVSLG